MLGDLPVTQDARLCQGASWPGLRFARAWSPPTDILLPSTEFRRRGVMGRRRCTEPSLDELFGDIAIQLLMQRDRVTEREVRALLVRVKQARTGSSDNSLMDGCASTRARQTPGNLVTDFATSKGEPSCS